jgi:hypothetical protein
MPLRAPHEYKVNRAAKAITDIREFPIVRFIRKQFLQVGRQADGSPILEQSPDFHHPILYQSGKFYYEDGTEISRKDVPTYILKQLREHPPPKDSVITQREMRMTLEEAETLFADPNLDTRIQERMQSVAPAAASNSSARQVRGRHGLR